MAWLYVCFFFVFFSHCNILLITLETCVCKSFKVNKIQFDVLINSGNYLFTCSILKNGSYDIVSGSNIIMLLQTRVFTCKFYCTCIIFFTAQPQCPSFHSVPYILHESVNQLSIYISQVKPFLDFYFSLKTVVQ